MLIKLKLLFTLAFSTVNHVEENKIVIGELDKVLNKNATLIELMEKYNYKIEIDTTQYKPL